MRPSRGIQITCERGQISVTDGPYAETKELGAGRGGAVVPHGSRLRLRRREDGALWRLAARRSAAREHGRARCRGARLAVRARQVDGTAARSCWAVAERSWRCVHDRSAGSVAEQATRFAVQAHACGRMLRVADRCSGDSSRPAGTRDDRDPGRHRGAGRHACVPEHGPAGVSLPALQRRVLRQAVSLIPQRVPAMRRARLEPVNRAA